MEPHGPHGGGNVKARIWMSRALGLVLLAGAILAVAAAGGSLAVSAAVITGFAAYVFLSERVARKLTVDQEKRLRMNLLVHNLELENMAMQDDLTRLLNRRYFFERLDRELESARAFNKPLSVMVIDLDGMKQVNDGFGHKAGDDLLSSFGKFLLGTTRASDVPARVGGDEFAIILPDTSDKSAIALKERLARRLADTKLVEDVNVPVSASFGVASFPSGGADIDSLLQCADLDMYQDKNLRKAERDTAGARAS